MSTVVPHSELTRKAVTWISEKREQEPDIPDSRLLDEAAQRFNLGPKDVEFLQRFLAGEKTD